MLEISDALHRYDDVVAVDDVSLTAQKGEFLTILGESGSGKTTLLRIISGLEKPTSIGAIRIAGEDVVSVPASDRNCTTVFQHYALFPHMSVGENVEYGSNSNKFCQERLCLSFLNYYLNLKRR
jgi:ABC-type Fe3+/spermidine/putrescine transport system ATPase subunit